MTQEIPIADIESQLITAGEMAGADYQAPTHDNLWEAIRVALAAIRIARKERDDARAGFCSSLIPNTVVVCGEGGNFCSEHCRLKARPFETLQFAQVGAQCAQALKEWNSCELVINDVAKVLQEAYGGTFERDQIAGAVRALLPEIKPCPFISSDGWLMCQLKKGHGGKCQMKDISLEKKP